MDDAFIRCSRRLRLRDHYPQLVIAGLDPAIHPVREKVLRRTMDPRVKPAGDAHRLGASARGGVMPAAAKKWRSTTSASTFARLSAGGVETWLRSRARRATRPAR